MTGSAMVIVFLVGFGLIAVLTLLGAAFFTGRRGGAEGDRPFIPYPDDDDDNRGVF